MSVELVRGFGSNPLSFLLIIQDWTHTYLDYWRIPDSVDADWDFFGSFLSGSHSSQVAERESFKVPFNLFLIFHLYLKTIRINLALDICGTQKDSRTLT